MQNEDEGMQTKGNTISLQLQVSVFVLYTFLFCLLSMLSVIDEYVNVRRFHWIMLRFIVDKSLVEVYDPLKRDLPFDDMKAMLHK